MKTRLLLGLVVLGLFWSGCKGKSGPAGADGLNGTNGGDATANVYTAVFTTGLQPSTFYSDVRMNRIDSANATSIYQNDGSLYFNNASGEKSVLLIKFEIEGYIPSNATLRSAVVELVALSTTLLGGVVTTGVHEVKTNDVCAWTHNANWNTVDGSGLWGSCNGGSPLGFSTNSCNPVMGTCVLNSAFNGETRRIGLVVSTAAISDWLAGNNNGLAIVSENMGLDTPGLAVFAAPNNGNVNYRPTLKINYTL